MLRKKKKNNGSKKARGSQKSRKLVPLPLYTKSSGGLGLDVDQVDASVLYTKSSTAAFEIKLKDVAVRNAVPSSYDICFVVPGYGLANSQGVLCDLKGTTVELKNPSPYVITVRAQRPMGYVKDCAALAMWEPLNGRLTHEIKPGKAVTLHSSNAATDHMVPREETMSAKRVVHLFSMSLVREELSVAGTQATGSNEIGLICEVMTRYKTVNGSVGEEDGYLVQKYAGSDRMNHVTNGPLEPLRFADIGLAGGSCQYVSFDANDSTKHLQVSFSADKKGGALTAESDLDKKCVYRTDIPIFMAETKTGKPGVAQYMKFNNKEGWVYGFYATAGGESTFFSPGMVQPNYFTPSSVPVSTWLYPLSENASTSSVSVKRLRSVLGIQSLRTGHTDYEELRALEDGFWETALKALVVIYEVSKVAVEILGVAGVLEDSKVGLALQAI